MMKLDPDMREDVERIVGALRVIADTLQRLFIDNPGLNEAVSDLELTVRAENALKNLRVTTLRDLVEFTDRDLLRIPNFGRVSLNEIKEELAHRGLHLGMRTRTAKVDEALTAMYR